MTQQRHDNDGSNGDNENNKIYTIQLDGNSADGNLVISQLDHDGSRRGWMKLKHCGHGVAMGVQSRGKGKAPWIWTEESHGEKQAVRGTGLMRFVWDSGITIAKGSKHTQYYKPFPHSSINTCTIDPVNHRMAVRYLPQGKDKGLMISIFQMDAKHPETDLDESTLVCTVPAHGESHPAGEFQGYALHGDYLYFLTGDKDKNGGGNTAISFINIQNPKVTHKPYHLGHADGREPEGMAIQVVHHPAQHKHKVRLCFGFSSKDRKASIWFKDVIG